MQPEKEHAEMNQFSAGVETVECPSCRAMMMRGMRFCRLCGYRLGEGVEEYAETRRFDGAPAATAPHASRTTAAPPEAAPQDWGAMTPSMQTAPLGQFETGWQQRLTKALKCNPRQMNWGLWLILAIAIMAASGGIVFRPFSDSAPPEFSISGTSGSYVGLSFEDAEEGTGAFIKSIIGVGAPAEQAGLIGGDIITSFDGKRVEGERDLLKYIRATPVGETVDVEYIRDGETKQTALTTASVKDKDALTPPPPPGGEGFFGIDPGEIERVAVPETNLHGVQLNDVLRNQPADIAGIRNGDIIIEFNGSPVRTERDLLRRINQAQPRSIVKIILMRGKERLEIPVKMGID